MSILHIGESDFDEKVLKSTLPVLVDFWADWCGPCKMIAPVLDEIADEFDGKIVVAKVDVDENPELALEYQVTTIPNLILFKDGVVAEQSIGLVSKENITQMFDGI